MTLDKLDDIWKEAVALHDLLGQFVEADKIFVAFQGEDDFMVVVREGDREAVFHLGKLPGFDWEKFQDKWNEVTAIYNKSSRVERKHLLDYSDVRKRAVEIVMVMTTKGFTSRGEN